MKRFRDILLLFSLCCIFFACKPGVPGEIIQPDDMEEILIDIHVADGMAQSNPAAAGNIEYYRLLYRLGVLKKHDVTQAEFDSSMVYYARYPDRLQGIYENVADRLGKKALALGASAADIGRYGTLASDADTTNVWLGENSIVLLPQPPYNVSSFTIVADSAYHKGDRMILNFDSDFIFQDGVQSGVAMLSVKFANDSVASNVVYFSGSEHRTVEVADSRHLGIKEVNGFFYMSDGVRAQNLTTLKLAFIYNVRLIRFHENSKNMPPSQVNKEPMARPEMRPDTVLPMNSGEGIERMTYER
ncbi:MAG: DUF4296 domain-containing protein [Prevotella sp.]|uniref:DUF4296 domain-containing protein n=1 Tax=Prevotella sp. TaxID=59823 RepID=UPI002A353DF2|nr:DUF4296 domain-containing protein [Prevotella sp.]MDD7318115.1 DUF4296 domain-containing protein [Prevotellaceae bacterium]MDY4020996.1 DUF4296 domain-containing protein [Prevotella sp.]